MNYLLFFQLLTGIFGFLFLIDGISELDKKTVSVGIILIVLCAALIY